MRGGRRNVKPVIWNGKEYPSIREMAKEHNISATNISHKIEKDRPLKGHYIDYKI